MQQCSSTYPVEIEVAFGLDRNKTDLIISQLARSGRITSTPVGNGERLMVAAKAKSPSAHRQKARKTTSAQANQIATKDKNKVQTKSSPNDITEVIDWLDRLIANAPKSTPLLTKQILDKPKR